MAPRPQSRSAVDNADGPSSEVITETTSSDILLGRGPYLMQHEGNIQFREIVYTRRAEYTATVHNKGKQQIARELYDEISITARFLSRLDPSVALTRGVALDTKAWVIATKEVALEKIKQALRKPCEKGAKVAEKSAKVTESTETAAAQFIPGQVDISTLQHRELLVQLVEHQRDRQTRVDQMIAVTHAQGQAQAMANLLSQSELLRQLDRQRPLPMGMSVAQPSTVLEHAWHQLARSSIPQPIVPNINQYQSRQLRSLLTNGYHGISNHGHHGTDSHYILPPIHHSPPAATAVLEDVWMSDSRATRRALQNTPPPSFLVDVLGNNAFVPTPYVSTLSALPASSRLSNQFVTTTLPLAVSHPAFATLALASASSLYTVPHGRARLEVVNPTQSHKTGLLDVWTTQADRSLTPYAAGAGTNAPINNDVAESILARLQATSRLASSIRTTTNATGSMPLVCDEAPKKRKHTGQGYFRKGRGKSSASQTNPRV